jgi:hypothetical protein
MKTVKHTPESNEVGRIRKHGTPPIALYGKIINDLGIQAD